MDLSQALLCLVSFTSPAGSGDTAVKSHYEVTESAPLQMAKFDLDFHLLTVEKDGGSTVMQAGMGFNLNSSQV